MTRIHRKSTNYFFDDARTGSPWDKTYLPLTAQVQVTERLTEYLPKRVNVYKMTQQARKALSVISDHYADFYPDKTKGLPRWITDRHYAAGTCRPWINSD
ncbi:MAG: hypothetical protein NT028_02250, partial [candidate division Zixibacteria bacterium]|nr:hypothetical protein [candidate division Zixibacteria bacterium]